MGKKSKTININIDEEDNDNEEELNYYNDPCRKYGIEKFEIKYENDNEDDDDYDSCLFCRIRILNTGWIVWKGDGESFFIPDLEGKWDIFQSNKIVYFYSEFGEFDEDELKNVNSFKELDDYIIEYNKKIKKEQENE